MAWRRGQAYGQDLRERVLGAWELSVRAAAVRFAVSPSYVAKVRGRLRRTGDTAPPDPEALLRTLTGRSLPSGG